MNRPIQPFVGPLPRQQLEDQVSALRGAIRHRDEQTGRRHFVHEKWCRARYARWLLEMRAILREERAE